MEQDWVYTPDQTPPASPQAAPATSYVMCSATDASPTAYVGAMFQVTAVDTAKWTSAFGQFLAEKYGYKGAGLGCSVLHEDSSRTFLRGRIVPCENSVRLQNQYDTARQRNIVTSMLIPNIGRR